MAGAGRGTEVPEGREAGPFRPNVGALSLTPGAAVGGGTLLRWRRHWCRVVPLNLGGLARGMRTSRSTLESGRRSTCQSCGSLAQRTWTSAGRISSVKGELRPPHRAFPGGWSQWAEPGLGGAAWEDRPRRPHSGEGSQKRALSLRGNLPSPRSMLVTEGLARRAMWRCLKARLYEDASWHWAGHQASPVPT